MSVPEPAEPNPYQPPQACHEGTLRPPARTDRPQRRWAVLLGGIGGLSYLGFIVVLIRSTPQDRVAGVIFLGNLTLWLAIAIWESIRYRTVWRSYSVLVVGQLVIMAGMLLAGFGDPESVLNINLIIMGIAAGLAVASLTISKYVRLSRLTS